MGTRCALGAGWSFVRSKRMKGERRIPLFSRGSLRSLASVPICGFVGWNGSGKSLAAVAAAMVHLERGRPVLSTCRLNDWTNPRPCDDVECQSTVHGEEGHMAAHPLWVPFTDLRQLFDFEDGHILMDEVTGVADAREHQGMPVQVANYLPQLRRRNVTLHWTTIGWSFADVRIRRVTLAVCHSAAFFGLPQKDSLWMANRGFLWRVYSGEDFDALESHKSEGMRVLSRHVFWRPGSVVQTAYDTNEPVLALGAVTDSGMCLVCGGRRSPSKCQCLGRAPKTLKADLAAPEARRSPAESGESLPFHLSGVPTTTAAHSDSSSNGASKGRHRRGVSYTGPRV